MPDALNNFINRFSCFYNNGSVTEQYGSLLFQVLFLFLENIHFLVLEKLRLEKGLAQMLS